MREVVAMAFGGGVNSTALGIWCALERACVPDLITFADTGGERPETYAWVEEFSEWMQGYGLPAIITVRYVDKHGDVLTLEDNCLKNNMLPSLAYGFKKCSKKFKRAPQDKYMNNWQPARDAWARGEKVIKLIGYDADEPHRASIPNDDKYDYRYPLIEMGWGREECVDYIKAQGLPVPGKSSCFFCPASTVKEILDLPCDLQTRAIAMEDNAELITVKGLGRRLNWKRLIQNDYDQARLPFMPPPPPCDCFDGGADG